MKKIFFFLLVFPFISFAQQEGKPFRISGKVKNLAFQPEWVYLQYRTEGEWKTDSCDVREGKYQFSGKLSEPTAGRIRVKYLPGSDGKKISMVSGRDVAMVFLQPGKIKVTSLDSFSHVQVKGSPSHKQYIILQDMARPFDDRLTPLYSRYNDFYKAKDEMGMEKTDKEIDAINEEKKETVYAAYVRNNPASPIAVYALQQYTGWDINPDKAEPLFSSLSDGNKKYPTAIRLHQDIEIAKKTGIGRVAMEFSQNDTMGNPVALSSFRGSYLLIDFWASWCGPCRAENPNVVKVFQSYKNRKFHILGVSLDRPGQKEKWMKAIHDDKLDWSHVSDLKFWDNEVAKQYGIKAIPQNLLLNPEGIIIAKNLRGADLEAKLTEIMDGKKSSF